MPGLLVPARAPDGRIRGICIRPDHPGDGGKYRWLFSHDKPGGTAAGAHCHVARPKLCPISDRAIWFTEGEVKADIAAERLGAVVVSIPGVTSWALAVPDILELLPDGGRVVGAMDGDWATKPQVHTAIWRLSMACQALGYVAEVATWQQLAYKGLDDLLAVGHHPRRMAPAEMPVPTWEAKISSILLAETTARQAMEAIMLTDARRKLREMFRTLSPCS
jgi:hypothetical protein